MYFVVVIFAEVGMLLCVLILVARYLEVGGIQLHFTLLSSVWWVFVLVFWYNTDCMYFVNFGLGLRFGFCWVGLLTVEVVYFPLKLGVEISGGMCVIVVCFIVIVLGFCFV